MNPVEILYTPLDTPDLPKINLLEFKGWLDKNQQYNSKYDSGQITSSSLFPWNVSYIKESGKWIDNFNNKFPELSEYMSSAFQLKPEDIVTIIVARTRSDFEGYGFWHFDVDSSGLRFYIENEETKDFLFIKPTIKPYNHNPQEKLKDSIDGIDPVKDSPQIQNNIIYSAKLLKPTQCFYLNSIRGIHATKTNKKGNNRILIALTIDLKISAQDMPNQLKELIVNSAQKYKDHAIMWTNPL